MRANLVKRRIKITTTQQVHDHLAALVATGLYGSSVSAAAEQVLCETLRKGLAPISKKTLERNTGSAS